MTYNLGLSGWAQTNHMRVEEENRRVGKRDMTTEKTEKIQIVTGTRPAIAGFEDRGRRPQAKGCGQALEAGKGTRPISSRM